MRGLNHDAWARSYHASSSSKQLISVMNRWLTCVEMLMPSVFDHRGAISVQSRKEKNRSFTQVHCTLELWRGSCLTSVPSISPLHSIDLVQHICWIKLPMELCS
uniref:Uncharacterized protein n=1 Tax=Arundo donax TaxID=35708 RepID=A0A0A9HG03_ARUDO